GGYYDSNLNLIREERVTVLGTPLDFSTTNRYGGRGGLVGGGGPWSSEGARSFAGGGIDWYTFNYAFGFAPFGFVQGIGWGNAGGWSVCLANQQATAQAFAFASNTAGQGLVHPLFP